VGAIRIMYPDNANNGREMYVSDARFRSNYDATAPGLAAFIRDAAHANASRAEPGS
jgi:hypothetical protein